MTHGDKPVTHGVISLTSGDISMTRRVMNRSGA